ncbi:MAG: type IV pilin protein [Pseudomonadaceae bacterium]
MNKSRGFTLIEVMIVVVIIGLLAAIAYPAYTSYVERGLQREAQGQIMELASALERHRTKNFSYQGATVAALAPELNANANYTAQLNIGGTNQTYQIVVTPRGRMTGTDTLTWRSDGTASWE